MADRFFPYRFDKKFLLLWKVPGARPGKDGVTITDDDRFVATFGRFTVDTPLTNIAGGHASGPYRFYTAVGLRLSFVDDGLTFGTTADGGVCVHFVEPIPKVIGMRPRHSALTVTVDDCVGLVDVIGEFAPS